MRFLLPRVVYFGAKVLMVGSLQLFFAPKVLIRISYGWSSGGLVKGRTRLDGRVFFSVVSISGLSRSGAPALSEIVLIGSDGFWA